MWVQILPMIQINGAITMEPLTAETEWKMGEDYLALKKAIIRFHEEMNKGKC